MHRLREFETVAITLPEDGLLRDATFKCHVVAIAGTTVALEPIDRAAVTWLPEEVWGAFLLFGDKDGLVALKGTLVQRDTIGDLRFKVSDTAQSNRRKASRVVACLPVTVRRDGDVEGVEGLTVNISADGLLVETRLDAPLGTTLEVSMSLPGSDDPVVVGANVVRLEPGRLALRLDPAARDAARRLGRFVLERNRALLHRGQQVHATADLDF
jgi:hypothetical protein